MAGRVLTVLDRSCQSGCCSHVEAVSVRGHCPDCGSPQPPPDHPDLREQLVQAANTPLHSLSSPIIIATESISIAEGPDSSVDSAGLGQIGNRLAGNQESGQGRWLGCVHSRPDRKDVGEKGGNKAPSGGEQSGCHQSQSIRTDRHMNERDL